jgi:hypothetical protein
VVALVVCLAALAVTLVVLAGESPRRQSPRVDGISDQNLAHWDGAAFDAASFAARPFPNMVRDALVRGGSRQIRFARFVVPWNVMAVPHGEVLHFALFAAWLADVRWLGLKPDVAIEQAEAPTSVAAGTLGRIPSSTASYRAYVGALLGYAASVGEPIRYLEAWNEPNNTGTGPVDQGHPSAARAAAFMNTAGSLCAAWGCTPIAGDFLDSQYARPGHPEAREGGLGMGVAYEREYLADLTAPYPLNWGFHPYAAVKYRTTDTLVEFERALASEHVAVWLTEVGAYLCEGGRDAGPAAQAAGARYLEGLITPALKVAHAFYYELKAQTAQQEAGCPGRGGADTSLYSASDLPRPAVQALFGGATPDATR